MTSQQDTCPSMNLYTRHSMSTIRSKQCNYTSETFQTLLQAAMRTIDCKDGLLFVRQYETDEFDLFSCIMTSPSSVLMSSLVTHDGHLVNIYKNASWFTDATLSQHPLIFTDEVESNTGYHTKMQNFAVIPLLLKEDDMEPFVHGVVVLGNRRIAFKDVRDLDIARSWMDALQSVLSMYCQKQILLKEQNENVSARQSYRILQEAKRVMLETRAISEAKDTFLATMSHEIRTPLNGILGMTDVLSHTSLNENQAEYLETIHHCSVQLLEIINDILDYSKMAANALKLEICEFDIYQCVEEAYDVVILQAEEKNLTFTYFVDPSVPAILIGDSKRIKQILVNLLSNAVKFTNSGKVHTNLRWEETTRSLRVKVSDTGIGIPKKDIHRVFQTFVQLDNDIKKPYNGTGLGLGIVRELLHLMNGNYKLKSKSTEDGHDKSNTGTKIFIYIPLEVPEEQLLEQEIADEYDEGIEDINNRNVIIYDGDADSRISLCSCLMKWNVHPYCCSSYQEVKMFLKNSDLKLLAIFVDMDTSDSYKVLTGVSTHQVPVVRLVSINNNDTESNHRRILKPIKCRKVKSTLISIVKGYSPSDLSESSPSQSPTASSISSSSSVEDLQIFHILIAEDNLDNQKVICNLLRLIGEDRFVCKLAKNGKEAVEMATKEKFHLILMDIRMPIMDGFEATRRIRAVLNKKCPYIVAVTATVFENDRQKCIEAGMDAYISKPINFQELKTLISLILEKLVKK